MAFTTCIFILFLGFSGSSYLVGSKSIRSVDKDTWIIYHERTIALAVFNERDNLQNCTLHSVKSRDDLNGAVEELQKEVKGNALGLGFSQMMDILKACQQLDGEVDVKTETEEHARKILSLIMPGTLWCGPGNKAGRYHELGENFKADSCCRIHDFCPVSLDNGDTKYGITNKNGFTISACKCDELFRECLEANHNHKSDLVGTMFFNVIKPKCIQVGESCDDNNVCEGVVLEVQKNASHYSNQATVDQNKIK